VTRVTLANEKFADRGIANWPLAAPEKFVGATLVVAHRQCGRADGQPQGRHYAEMCTNEAKRVLEHDPEK
jgi:hypothetical protein